MFLSHEEHALEKVGFGLFFNSVLSYFLHKQFLFHLWTHLACVGGEGTEFHARD